MFPGQDTHFLMYSSSRIHNIHFLQDVDNMAFLLDVVMDCTKILKKTKKPIKITKQLQKLFFLRHEQFDNQCITHFTTISIQLHQHQPSVKCLHLT